MTELSFDRMLRGALEDGPQIAPAFAIDAAIQRAATSRQRRHRFSSLNTQAWPAPRRSIAGPALRRQVRLALVAVVVVLATAAVIVVGSRLLHDVPPLPFSERAVFVAASPLPEKFEVAAARLTADGKVAFIGPQWVDTSLGPQWGPWVVNVWDPSTQELRSAAVGATQGYAGIAALPDDRMLLIDAGGQFANDAVKTASVLDLRTADASPTGAMTWLRISFVTLALRDGDVLVTGGEQPEQSTTLPPDTADGEPASAWAELYDPTTGRFTPVGPMTVGREGHAMVELADGRVLILGGYAGTPANGVATSSAELFDRLTGTFRSTGTMSVPRSSLEAAPVLLADGRVLVIGGADGDGRAMFDASALLKRTGAVSSELYDPGTGKFSPGPTVPHDVSSAALLPDGTVLLLGTWWESHQPAEMVMSSMRDEHHYAWAGILDLATGVTREIPAPVGAPTAAYPFSVATQLADGRVVVAQGYDANDRESPDGYLAIFEDPR